MNYYNHFKTLLTSDAQQAWTSLDKGRSDYEIDVALGGYIGELNILNEREKITDSQLRGYTNRLEIRACVLKERNYKAIDKKRSKKVNA